jgi:hypothetical protein
MEIHIGRSGRHCAACENRFEHEQRLVSVVHVVEGALVRKDYCTACWQDDFGRDAYSFWESHYYDPQVAEQAPEESFSPLRQAFYRAAEGTDRHSLAVAYLSAQLLRRQKVFRLIKESTDPDTEAAMLLFSDRIGNRLIEVKDPNLTHAELEAGRIHLLQQLNALESPESAEDEAPESETPADAEEIADGTLNEASA